MGVIPTDIGDNRPVTEMALEYVTFNTPLNDMRENDGAALLRSPKADGGWRRTPYKIERHR